MLFHTSKVTGLVHDELIAWTSGLMRDSGLESVDVYGRFPPEGTVRSHLVLFPYRVGPEPKNLENSRGASIMTRDPFPSDRTHRVPEPWRELGRHLVDAMELLFPEAGQLDTPSRPNVMPFPLVDDLPGPLAEWYRSQSPEDPDPFVVEDEGEAYARPPSLSWRPGVSLWAHYIAVAGDAGRGVSDRTSDAPPLSLAALAVLTVGIQTSRVLTVELPPMPFDPMLNDYLVAMKESLENHPRPEAAATYHAISEALATLHRTAKYDFGVVPVHDLNMHEFALLTQALQRPLQAVLNFRLMFQLGDMPQFGPGSVVSFRYARRKGRR
jgi:hypothetical protein